MIVTNQQRPSEEQMKMFMEFSDDAPIKMVNLFKILKLTQNMQMADLLIFQVKKRMQFMLKKYRSILKK